MHVHPNQINPNVQLDALRATEKTASKAAAERTRRKLSEAASELAGDAAVEDAFVLEVEPREEGRDRRRQNPRYKSNASNKDSEEEDEDHSISDWA
jgi:hypothetical protein